MLEGWDLFHYGCCSVSTSRYTYSLMSRCIGLVLVEWNVLIFGGGIHLDCSRFSFNNMPLVGEWIDSFCCVVGGRLADLLIWIYFQENCIVGWVEGNKWCNRGGKFLLFSCFLLIEVGCSVLYSVLFVAINFLQHSWVRVFFSLLFGVIFRSF